jgi:hypothetical protein
MIGWMGTGDRYDFLLAYNREYKFTHTEGGEGSTSTVRPSSTISLSSDRPLSANMFERDMSRHPWALKQMFRNRPPAAQTKLDELSLVLEWQECEPVDQNTQ